MGSYIGDYLTARVIYSHSCEIINSRFHFCVRRSFAMATKGLLSPQLRDKLKNQYSLVGTHSAIKVCHWTKSMLRGRGGCYKLAFYGIQSHRCMEMTPALACANKCIFCWRLGSNPVAKEWKWSVDDPEAIVSDALTHHERLVRSWRGVGDVLSARYAEAQQPRHCAMSLVGEPITYPRINELLASLHRRRISSFLVSNGQHPDAVASIGPLTQLYLSVDAGTPETLKAIDRPLFDDYWERLLASCDALREHRHTKGRTVLRLTLVREWNMSTDDIIGYGKLIARAAPDFVEIKAVAPTFNQSRKLTMASEPSWADTVAFAEAVAASAVAAGCDYVPASQHAHSKCLLLAARPHAVSTWINYAEFFRRVGVPVGADSEESDAAAVAAETAARRRLVKASLSHLPAEHPPPSAMAAIGAPLAGEGVDFSRRMLGDGIRMLDSAPSPRALRRALANVGGAAGALPDASPSDAEAAESSEAADGAFGEAPNANMLSTVEAGTTPRWHCDRPSRRWPTPPAPPFQNLAVGDPGGAVVPRGATLTALDYASPTPEWALFGAGGGGFVPGDARRTGRSHEASVASVESFEAAVAERVREERFGITYTDGPEGGEASACAQCPSSAM